MAVLADEKHISLPIHGNDDHRAAVLDDLESRLSAVGSPHGITADLECASLEERF
jgi:hypothetical protein